MTDQCFDDLERHGDTVGYCNAQADEARSRGDSAMVAYWGSMAKLAAVLTPQPAAR